MLTADHLIFTKHFDEVSGATLLQDDLGLSPNELWTVFEQHDADNNGYWLFSMKTGAMLM